VSMTIELRIDVLIARVFSSLSSSTTGLMPCSVFLSFDKDI